jgi:toxin ParE1/3/4
LIRREVVYAPEAEADLLALYERIAAVASADVALAYMSRLMAWLDGFDVAAERGTRRDDLRPGLRIVGFERRITVAFAVIGDRAVILRLFYGGQDWSRFFAT